MGKAGRQRQKATKTDAEVFADLGGWFGEQPHTLKRNQKKLTEYPCRMFGLDNKKMRPVSRRIGKNAVSASSSKKHVSSAMIVSAVMTRA
ncbi:hypothetical protein PhaeoP97_02422 [Phaeobacter porticola]|uniref:Uncharacterized protein n=1 Tax=Phaeobacter porticola TaxID=1844006 RepID=A0A1L3I6T7_9RHOB|nr:hypothetical protein PhaeoP97_02422 [Phaeobacter porticola]